MTERESLDAALRREMARTQAAGLARTLEPNPAGAVDFTSNDVLGLARHPAVIEGARAALETYGAGGRAARLLGGGCPLDAQAEVLCAQWLSAPAALLFASGYHANLGLVTALAAPGDVIVSDERNHASIVDAARLSRARKAIVPHLDVDAVERALKHNPFRRALVLTESIFSMDGDLAPLAALADVCARHGAYLVVDEAHAVGLIGPEGAGGISAAGLEYHPALAARIVTGGKALGAQGALVVGSTALREHLIQNARSFVYTTASSPAVAGALCAAIPLARMAKGARQLALEHARALTTALGLAPAAGAIVPIAAGTPQQAMAAASALRERGLLVRAVRPPTVPEGRSQLRVITSARQRPSEVQALVQALMELGLPRRATDASGPLSAAPRAKARTLPLFVAGTDTGVGKTVVSALLAGAAAKHGQALYWKPVQTGSDDDARTVGELASHANLKLCPNAYHFSLPAAPDQAAAAQQASIDVHALRKELESLDRERGDARLVVELAGGLCVPLTERYLQIDWLEQARAQLVLVARSGLGTLNHTLLSFEALRRRNLEPRALFLVGPPHEANRVALERLIKPRRIFEVPLLEELSPARLAEWTQAHDALELFDEAPIPQPAPETMPAPSTQGASLVERDAKTLWHPYTQHGLEASPLPIQSARGSTLVLEEGTKLLDAISSWWTCLHGHGHPRLVAAYSKQAARLDHVLFAGCTHEPAVALAEALLARAPRGLKRVFFSDNGSTAVEVALKIVLQAHLQRGAPERNVFVALEGAYHGDTFGAMSVGEREPFFTPFGPLLFDVYRAAASARAIERALSDLGERCAGVILEPLVQGAGGMLMHTPEFLQAVRAACDLRQVPLIADEVMTGFGRTGALFACQKAAIEPDLMCLAKGLTGGMGPLSATLAREQWYDAFLSKDRSKAFFHGHSFTANPSLCAVALESLALCAQDNVPEKLDGIGARIEQRLARELDSQLLPSLRRTGGIVAFDLPAPNGPQGYLSNRALELRERAITLGVLLRPLGNTVYAMPPACTTEQECDRIADAMVQLTLPAEPPPRST